jgi:hypothetical protein
MNGTGFYPRRSITFVPPSHFRRPTYQRRLLVIRPEDVAWMTRQLSGKGWQTATDLGAKSGSQKRRLKAIVEAASGEILHFRGSPGYCLTREATRGQILRAIATLRVDARVPIRRARHYLLRLKSRAIPVTPELFPRQ